MSSTLDFSDVILALLPSGSAWSVDESPHVVGAVTQLVGFIPAAVDYLLSSTDWTLYPKTGDIIRVSGSVLNDGDWTVAADWDASDPTKIYVEGTLVFEAPGNPQKLEWIKEGGDLKRMILACGDNHQAVRDFLETLAYLRDPQNTPILSDLEKEYGLLTNTGLTEQERRDQLDSIVYAPAGTGAASYLEANLQAGGFDVYVYQNSPVTDPGAFYGGPGGEIITNTTAYDRTITDARVDQSLWPFVFFIGGTAYYDAAGKIVHIEPVAVSDALKPSFRRIVLQCKPVHSWALAIINAERYFTFSDDDTATLDTTHGFANVDQTTGGFWCEEGDDFSPPWVQVLIDDETGAVLTDDETGAALIDG